MSALPSLGQYKYENEFYQFLLLTWLLKSLGRCVWLVFVAHILLLLDSPGLDFPEWLLSIFPTSPAPLAFLLVCVNSCPHWYWKCRLERKQSWRRSLFCTSEPLLTPVTSSGNSQLSQRCTSICFIPLPLQPCPCGCPPHTEHFRTSELCPGSRTSQNVYKLFPLLWTLFPFLLILMKFYLSTKINFRLQLPTR